MLFPWMLQMKNDLKATLDLLFRVRFLDSKFRLQIRKKVLIVELFSCGGQK